MPEDSTPNAQPLARRAARVSWIIGVISILLLAISRGRPIIVELTVPILILLGLACGISALSGIRRHGAAGIRIPALAGVLINGLLVCFFACMLLFVSDGPHSQKAKQARAKAAAQINETSNDLKPDAAPATSLALPAAGNASASADTAETKYLAFQLMTVPGVSFPMAFAEQPPSAPSKAQMEAFVRELTKAIGATGDARHKLCFVPTHIRFDESDAETRRLIHDAFAVARENDVAVAFHLDDCMYWGGRKDLISDPDNIETADWKQIPSTGRRVDWGRTPSRFVPQMCFNSPAVVAAVKARGALIGAEVKKETDALKAAGKEHLFAGVIAGSESQIGRDFATDRSLGYRALSHRGFSESHPPKDADLERAGVLKEFMELWADSLHAAGVPRERIFCHIAFTDQGLRKADAKESYLEKVHFAPAEVAFSGAYRPGFSTYPEGATFKQIFAAVAEHGSPGWCSAEGANVSPTSMPGEPNMETYLGRMFNHGAVVVNVFSWGVGGESQRKNNFFRKATESPECLSAYAKFLRGEKLVESAPTGFSSEGFQAKMQRIQKELPAWVSGHADRQAQAMSRMQKIQPLLKAKKWQEADKVADEILSLLPPGEKK